MTQTTFSSEHQVLIANRGEVAVRIIRACRDFGAKSIAVYADVDAGALHTRLADQAYALDGNTVQDSYLNIEKLIAIAKHSGATMIHPGYGFLSERAEFAKAVEQAGLIWIGPNARSIEILGNKIEARHLAQKVGAPLAKGTAEPVKDVSDVIHFAQQNGFPIAIKAAFGGGGKGLKVVRQFDEIEELYDSAVRESQAAFGRSECFIEQYLDKPRHIEVQIIADNHQNIVVLGTRDCSLQRRHQKLVEEAPAPFISETQRQILYKAACDICKQANYVGAATVEFLLSTHGTISFLEVNTRLQVEHTITEETTGIDIVLEQLRIASGLELSILSTPEPRGHSFEFRINAEDPGKGFLPTPGIIHCFRPPSGPGVRLDSGVADGSTVPGQFDSLIAKLIVTGRTRERAIQRAKRALDEFKIEGVASIVPFHREVLKHEDFVSQFAIHTNWIESDFDKQIDMQSRPNQLNSLEIIRSYIEIDGKQHQLGISQSMLMNLSGLNAHIATEPSTSDTSPAALESESHVQAPLTGILTKWVAVDQSEVEKGQLIAVMEAMKMEVQIVAPCSGRLCHLVGAGDQLESDTPIARVDELTC
ncbi:MAG: Carbamoyl-phosphate synthase large chain [Candidatus Celerinatantimonas neptuna]|nr:MAG: Carbamoyl-phosphate synthase large chain [Candidatus Celerinatantimonas neptuna]